MTHPALQIIDISNDRHSFTAPIKCINDGVDVPRFLHSKAYRDIGLFLMQLNRSVVPRKTASGVETYSLPQGALASPLASLAAPPEDSSVAAAAAAAPAESSQEQPPLPEPIQRLQQLLERVDSFIQDAPPDPGPRRFGNISFRKWQAFLAEHTGALLDQLILPLLRPEAAPAKVELEAYFLGSFGSAQRLDYGTGHELSFLAFLGCLWKLGFFHDSTSDKTDINAASRQIVLDVFEQYLATIRKLIQTYTLEPAGSHGVWGLDDHAFLPYVFGSAQLTRPITDDEPTPLEGSVKGAPRTGDVVKSAVVERWRASNMYFSAIGFINDVKTGPFWEHSSMLYNISGVQHGWGKINKGMIKMFNAEVLSKFPVVQHFPFGSMFSWDVDPEAPVQSAAQPSKTSDSSIPPVSSRSMPPPATIAPPKGPVAGGVETTPGQVSMTKAPWAR